MVGAIHSLLKTPLDDLLRNPLIAAFKRGHSFSKDASGIWLRLPKAGLSFGANREGHIDMISLFAHGYDPEYEEYAGSLPGGIAFSDSRNAIRAKLGEPAKSGGGRPAAFAGRIATWDIFVFDSSYSANLKYSPAEDSVVLVTLMPIDDVPEVK